MTLRRKIIRLLSLNRIPFTPMEVFLKLENEDDFAAVGAELNKLVDEGRIEQDFHYQNQLFAFYTYREGA